MCIDFEDFETDGPQVSDVENGPEPSLFDIILQHYVQYFTYDEAVALTNQYITGWLRDRV